MSRRAANLRATAGIAYPSPRYDPSSLAQTDACPVEATLGRHQVCRAQLHYPLPHLRPVHSSSPTFA
jgi:hypothetical protein